MLKKGIHTSGHKHCECACGGARSPQEETVSQWGPNRGPWSGLMLGSGLLEGYEQTEEARRVENNSPLLWHDRRQSPGLLSQQAAPTCPPVPPLKELHERIFHNSTKCFFKLKMEMLFISKVHTWTLYLCIFGQGVAPHAIDIAPLDKC